MKKCALCNQEIRSASDLVHGVNGKVYHKACAEQNKLINCCHVGCDVYMMADEVMPITSKGFLCEEHFNCYFVKCAECGEVVPIRYSHMSKNSESQKLCQHCFEEKYFECEMCGRTHKKSEKTTIEYKHTKINVCKKCAEKYIPCPTCGRTINRENDVIEVYYLKDGKKEKFVGCHDCVKDKFKKCPMCGEYYANDEEFVKSYSDRDERQREVCEGCHIKHGIIHQYMFKPRPVLFGVPSSGGSSSEDDGRSSSTPGVLFGVENEIELDIKKITDERGNTNRDLDMRRIELHNGKTIKLNYRNWMGYMIDQFMPDFLYQKSDSSIRFGMELVTHPASIEFWRSKEEDLKKLFDFLASENCQGEKAETVGMHVHITKKDMNMAHQNSFGAMIHGNRKFVEKIARRKSNHYSKMISISPGDRTAPDKFDKRYQSEHRGDRYEAVNWCPRNTVELRIFQSTIDVAHFLSNIEFCDAVYNFTKINSTAQVLGSRCIDHFKEFVNGVEKYSHLQQTLSEI